MKCNLSTSIALPVSKDSLSLILKVLESEFKKIAKDVSSKEDLLEVKQINPSRLNSGNRKDTTSIRIIPNEDGNGYLIEAETHYRKSFSFFFWDYLGLSFGIVLSFAVPNLLLFFLGWHCLCRLVEYYFYFRDESNMKKKIGDSLESAKQIVENDNNKKHGKTVNSILTLFSKK